MIEAIFEQVDIGELEESIVNFVRGNTTERNGSVLAQTATNDEVRRYIFKYLRKYYPGNITYFIYENLELVTPDSNKAVGKSRKELRGLVEHYTKLAKKPVSEVNFEDLETKIFVKWYSPTPFGKYADGRITSMKYKGLLFSSRMKGYLKA